MHLTCLVQYTVFATIKVTVVGVGLITLIIWSILIKIELKREIMKLGHGTHRQSYLIYFIFPVSMIIFLVVRVL